MKFKCKFCDSEEYTSNREIIKKRSGDNTQVVSEYDVIYCSKCKYLNFFNLISGVIPDQLLLTFKFFNCEIPEIKHVPSG